MQLFYDPSIPSIQPGTQLDHTLNETESGHMIRVLRLEAGDEIRLTNGSGSFFTGTILEPHPKRCTVRITDPLAAPETLPIEIAIAPTKNNNRMEWFLEKVTEIGIRKIVPLICSRSERNVINPDRWKKVLIAAMKQSLKGWLPVLDPATSFPDLLAQPFDGQSFIANADSGSEQPLAKLYHPGRPVRILIGPEGDFSDEEISMATQNGYIPVTLGQSRLRTETAGVVACSIVHAIDSMRQK